jgi:hypothetical protein
VNTSATSFAFVITAIYTYTFGNAIYQLLEFNEKTITIDMRGGTHLGIVACALMCMCMALRFFFGNNNYVDELYAKQQSAAARLYP